MLVGAVKSFVEMLREVVRGSGWNKVTEYNTEYWRILFKAIFLYKELIDLTKGN